MNSSRQGQTCWPMLLIHLCSQRACSCLRQLPFPSDVLHKRTLSLAGFWGPSGVTSQVASAGVATFAIALSDSRKEASPVIGDISTGLDFFNSVLQVTCTSLATPQRSRMYSIA